MEGKNILRQANERVKGQTYTKYYEINNNSENFRRTRSLLVSGLAGPPK